MRAVRLSSSTPVLRAPGASASGMSPKKCPTPMDGSRTCAPASTPRCSRASHTPEITRGDVKCALGVDARAEAYSSVVSSWRSSSAVFSHSRGGWRLKDICHRAPPAVTCKNSSFLAGGLAVVSLDLFQCADGGEVGESFFAKAALTDPVRCGYSEIAERFGYRLVGVAAKNDCGRAGLGGSAHSRIAIS